MFRGSNTPGCPGAFGAAWAASAKEENNVAQGTPRILQGRRWWLLLRHKNNFRSRVIFLLKKTPVNKGLAMETLEMPVGTPVRAELDDSIAQLYEPTFPLVARFVAKMGGSFADAKDIFHDALLIYYEKKRNQDWSASLAPEAYVLGIAKHLWLRKFRHDQGRVALAPEELAISIPPETLAEADNRLLALLQVSGRKCLELLRAFYYDQLGPAAIAHTFGYLTVRSATVQKYKCLEKVRDKVKEKSLRYEDLVDEYPID
jgi:DNA-directed RNA polymerase specialized sigma24 family protein